MTVKKLKNDPLLFSQEVYDKFLGLGERGLMTPSYFSMLIMFAILPAKLMVTKTSPLMNDDNGFCNTDSWFARYQGEFDQSIPGTHTYKALSIDGIETLECMKKQEVSNPHYEVFCCGNGQDAMFTFSANARITAQPDRNYIFWNYPGVGCSTGDSGSVSALFKAAHQQVRRLLDRGVPAKDITLRGLSLGGGVATHVARQLHEQGHLVNLEVDRSFAQLAPVIPAIIKNNLLNEDVYLKTVATRAEINTDAFRKDRATVIKIEDENKYVIYGNTDGSTWALTEYADFEKAHTATHSYYTPLLTSIIAFGLSGVALGTTFAGFVSTVGLMTNASIAAASYMGAYCIQVMGLVLQQAMMLLGEMLALPFAVFSTAISDKIKFFFNDIGDYLAHPFDWTAVQMNRLMSMMASYVDGAINLLGSIAGGFVSVGGLIAGSLLGLVVGLTLSVQLFWTNTPLAMPMTFAFSAALCSACCEMNSVNEIHRLLKADQQPINNGKEPAKISVFNTVDDEVIDVVASLNRGLTVEPGLKARQADIKQNIASFWYQAGGHGGKLTDLVVVADDQDVAQPSSATSCK